MPRQDKSPTPSSSKNRTPSGGSGQPMEQSRLDDYLAPLSWSSTATEGGTAALNDEQKRVLEMVIKDGKNVFFTGAAGTGKSLLLRAIIDTGCTVPFL